MSWVCRVCGHGASARLGKERMFKRKKFEKAAVGARGLVLIKT